MRQISIRSENKRPPIAPLHRMLTRQSVTSLNKSSSCRIVWLIRKSCIQNTTLNWTYRDNCSTVHKVPSTICVRLENGSIAKFCIDNQMEKYNKPNSQTNTSIHTPNTSQNPHELRAAHAIITHASCPFSKIKFWLSLFLDSLFQNTRKFCPSAIHNSCQAILLLPSFHLLYCTVELSFHFFNVRVHMPLVCLLWTLVLPKHVCVFLCAKSERAQASATVSDIP